MHVVFNTEINQPEINAVNCLSLSDGLSFSLTHLDTLPQTLIHRQFLTSLFIRVKEMLCKSGEQLILVGVLGSCSSPGCFFQETFISFHHIHAVVDSVSPWCCGNHYSLTLLSSSINFCALVRSEFALPRS